MGSSPRPVDHGPNGRWSLLGFGLPAAGEPVARRCQRVPVREALTRLSRNRVAGVHIQVKYDSVKELLNQVNVDTHDAECSHEGCVCESTNETASLVAQPPYACS